MRFPICAKPGGIAPPGMIGSQAITGLDLRLFVLFRDDFSKFRIDLCERERGTRQRLSPLTVHVYLPSASLEAMLRLGALLPRFRQFRRLGKDTESARDFRLTGVRRHRISNSVLAATFRPLLRSGACACAIQSSWKEVDIMRCNWRELYPIATCRYTLVVAPLRTARTSLS
jgi:hypothetical protein